MIIRYLQNKNFYDFQLNLRNVKAEPVIEEDWSFSDATEPMKHGSGDIVPPSGAILDKHVKPAVEDVPMIVDDDIITLTGNVRSILGTARHFDPRHREIFRRVHVFQTILSSMMLPSTPWKMLSWQTTYLTGKIRWSMWTK